LILFRHADPGKATNIWALPTEGDQKPFAVVKTNFDDGEHSCCRQTADGSYQSDDSGQFEIDVQRFPVNGRKERVSLNGGARV
jgi:hypothetical protein